MEAELYRLLIIFGAGSILIFAGKLLSDRTPGLSKIYIPGSVIAGLICLVIFQIGKDRFDVLAEFVVSDVFSTAKSLPAVLINIVFATLMLGQQQKSFKDSFKQARANILMGHIFAWGQHWLGALLTIFLLGALYENGQFLAPLIVIGFQGGHGTASGLEKTFSQLNFEPGVELGLGVATAGVLIGFTSGVALYHILRWREGRHTRTAQHKSEQSKEDVTESLKTRRKNTIPLVSGFTIQLAFVSIGIGLGWLLLEGLRYLEGLILGEAGSGISQYLPLFPVVLIATILLNPLLAKMKLDRYVDRKTIMNIGNASLDLLIVFAIATLNLDRLAEYWIALTTLVGAGVAWNVAVLLLIGKRVYPAPWYSYGLPDYGGATATTASGLLLANVSAPDEAAQNKRAYTLKQPFYEPFMGGGLVTALALPLIASTSLWTYFGIVSGVLVILGYFAFRIRIPSRHFQSNSTKTSL